MFRVFFALLSALLPALAHAQCAGRDLIADMPVDTRQTLIDRADATAYGHGILWQATREDRTITLFGTYHFRHAQTMDHLTNLVPLISQSDMVYLEVSNEDGQQLNRDLADDPSIMFITKGPTLPDLLGEKDWKAYSSALRRRNIPGFMAAKFKPVWATIMLGISPCEAQSGALQDTGIDMLIGESATAMGKPVLSLEDYRTLLRLMDDMPKDDQIDMIRMFLPWDSRADDMAHTLQARYLNEEIALIWEFSRHVTVTMGANAEDEFDQFEAQLLTQRNRDWIDTLRAAPAGDIFLAAGAAHLPGENGILKLLEAEGYTITRLSMP